MAPPRPRCSSWQLPPDAADPPRPWRWRRRLLDADLFEEAFTVDPVRYLDLRADRAGGTPWFEYDGDDGDSVRFGDGVFGERPATGTEFEVTYRVTARRRATSPPTRSPACDPAMSAVAARGDQPVRRDRRRRRGAARPGPPPRAAGVPGAPVPRGAARGLRRRRRGAALGARRRHRDPLDRQLADRLHHRPAARPRSHPGPGTPAADRAARPPPAGRATRSTSPTRATSGST